jgi:predicted nucleotidyltransferase component of viral defense system
MAKTNKPSTETAEYEKSEQIKRLVVMGIFSDDYLMEHLVLKGGNALNLVWQIGTRASVDIDLSMESDFPPKELEAIRSRLENRLQEVFNPEHYHVFDVTLEPKPDPVSPELAAFWGGYSGAFKLIEERRFKESLGDLAAMRRNSLMVGAKGKFEIDISKFEYCAPKRAVDMGGYQVFVYTAEMLVAEKLRAICQQMPEYGPVVKRTRAGSARARDFLDIHTLITHFKLNMATQKNLELIRLVFEAKRVPLELIGKIKDFRDFHRSDYKSVTDTVKPGVALQEFDFYFDFVLQQADKLLKALRNE